MSNIESKVLGLTNKLQEIERRRIELTVSIKQKEEEKERLREELRKAGIALRPDFTIEEDLLPLQKELTDSIEEDVKALEELMKQFEDEDL